MNEEKIPDKEYKIIDGELMGVLNKYKVQFATNISFPQFRILPDEVQLALKVLQNNGVSFSTIVVRKIKVEPKKEKKLLKH